MVDSITERSNSQQPVILANPVTAYVRLVEAHFFSNATVASEWAQWSVK
jgi:hypothetical protein